MNNYPNYNYEIETNGACDLYIDEIENLFQSTDKRLQFNISPKGNFEQCSISLNTDPILLDILNDSEYIIKVLFDSDEDIEYAKSLQQYYKIPSSNIWMQPKGIDSKTLRELSLKYFDKIIENGWNLSLRSHIFIFENKRGV